MNERDFTSDPSQMRDELHEVLREASFAASVGTPESIRSLTRLKSDLDIWDHDREVMDGLFTYSSLSRVGMGKSLLAPVAKMLARRELRAVTSSIKPETRVASARRVAHAASMAPSSSLSDPELTERVWLDHTASQSNWPSRDGVDLTPLQVALSSSTRYAVSLTAYQWEAVSVIETVRAAGKVIGNLDGDQLANQFQLMILAYGGIETARDDDSMESMSVRLRPLIYSDLLVQGAFIQGAVQGSLETFEPYSDLDELVTPSGRRWWPLSGPDQMLAITILAAWIRMSRLGVRLSSHQTLEKWRAFFDGTSYGYDSTLVGKGWLLPMEEALDSARRYTFFNCWNSSVEPPWLSDRGGTPMVFVGISARLLYEAVKKVGVLDKIPDDFVLPTHDKQKSVSGFRPSPQSEEPDPDRQLMELRRLSERISSSPVGCAYEVRLLKAYE